MALTSFVLNGLAFARFFLHSSPLKSRLDESFSEKFGGFMFAGFRAQCTHLIRIQMRRDAVCHSARGASNAHTPLFIISYMDTSRLATETV
jgi:hypothetical protein